MDSADIRVAMAVLFVLFLLAVVFNDLVRRKPRTKASRSQARSGRPRDMRSPHRMPANQRGWKTPGRR